MEILRMIYPKLKELVSEVTTAKQARVRKWRMVNEGDSEEMHLSITPQEYKQLDTLFNKFGADVDSVIKRPVDEAGAENQVGKSSKELEKDSMVIAVDRKIFRGIKEVVDKYKDASNWYLQLNRQVSEAFNESDGTLVMLFLAMFSVRNTLEENIKWAALAVKGIQKDLSTAQGRKMIEQMFSKLEEAGTPAELIKRISAVSDVPHPEYFEFRKLNCLRALTKNWRMTTQLVCQWEKGFPTDGIGVDIEDSPEQGEDDVEESLAIREDSRLKIEKEKKAKAKKLGQKCVYVPVQYFELGMANAYARNFLSIVQHYVSANQKLSRDQVIKDLKASMLISGTLRNTKSNPRFIGDQKVFSFVLNILDPTTTIEFQDGKKKIAYSPVTIDTWMCKFLYPQLSEKNPDGTPVNTGTMVNGKNVLGDKNYVYLSKLVAEEAKKLNILPNQLQAAIWVAQIKKTKTENYDTTFNHAKDKIFEKLHITEQVLEESSEYMRKIIDSVGTALMNQPITAKFKQ